MRKAVLTAQLGNLVSQSESRLATPAALHKFKLLAGPRYDPDTDTIKISSDSFPSVEMNIKWASDALDRLIAAAEVRSAHPDNSITLTSSLRTRLTQWQTSSLASHTPKCGRSRRVGGERRFQTCRKIG